MENKSFTARVAVGGLVFGGLLFSGCTGQPMSTPSAAVVPSASASAEPAAPTAVSVVLVSGEVTVAGTARSPGDAIEAGTEVTAVEAAQLKLGTTTVSLKKGTRLAIGSDGISLSTGAVRIDEDADRVAVRTGGLTVTPQGTGFAVAGGSSGSTVVVTSGAVDVTGLAEQSLRMIAGETLAVDPDRAGALSAKTPKDTFLAPAGQAKAGEGESSLRSLRLAGTFLMTLVVKKSNAPEAPPGLKLKRLWSFIPACEEGACDVSIKRPLLPFTCRTADGCGQKPTYNSGSLPYSNGTYAGFLLKGKTGCGTASGGTRKTKGTFNVSGATFANGGWVVTGLSGLIDDRASAFLSCAKMNLVTAITGEPSATAPKR